MSKAQQTQAIEDISNWSVDEVAEVLRKNGLEECCKAISKRRVDGDEFLHLTEGKLTLWKSDLGRPLIWDLWNFVEKVKKNPEKYVDEKKRYEEHLVGPPSDTDSWGTDFDDDAEDSVNRGSSEADEGTYANCDPIVDNGTPNGNGENIYMNYGVEVAEPKSVDGGKSLADQLKEQLQLINAKKKDEPVLNNVTGKLPQKSFLHDSTTHKQKRMNVPPPSKPKQVEVEKDSRPPTIRNLDLVANLPKKIEGSEDEYEAFDEEIIERHRRESMKRIGSEQSLVSGSRSSIESLSQSEEPVKKDCEIYESITEEIVEENSCYLKPLKLTKPAEAPPPLPVKPSPNISKETSVDKKCATLPHAPSANVFPKVTRVTRPLPPPPNRQPYFDKPWFHNITREQATALIKNQSTYGKLQDGCFLLRPSTTNPNNPLALVLWYKDRVYNVPVRKRSDERFALGSEKPNEQSFTNVEDIVVFYSREELVLHTGGVQTGSTKLTDTPAK